MSTTDFCTVSILEQFFNLRTWDELHSFVEGLDLQEPFQVALRYYAQTWPPAQTEDHIFEPAKFLAADTSAIFYGNCPVIFEGSNQWGRKCYAVRSEHDAKLEVIYRSCVRLRKQNPDAKVCLVMVPEKDLLISTVFLKEDRFTVMVDAVNVLKARLGKLDIQLVFDGPVNNMVDYQSLTDFEYPDSHLAPRNYAVIMSHSLRALGFNWDDVKPRLAMKRMDVYYDLSTKFDDPESRCFQSLELDFKDESIRQTGGSLSFEKPLGQTHQCFENDNPVFDEQVLILGDSHSSILKQRRITYLFAGAFRRVHFEWNPAGLRETSEISSYNNIVLEISSRFVF